MSEEISGCCLINLMKMAAFYFQLSPTADSEREKTEQSTEYLKREVKTASVIQYLDG